MPSSVMKIVAGFIAGALAVLVFHQAMYVAMQYFGLPLRGVPWNMSPDPAAYGMPRVLNQAFWGGLWGIVFAFLIEHMPVGPNWLRGFAFGVVFTWLIGSLLLLPLIKGQPLFSGAFGKDGFNILALRNGFLLNAVGFCIGLGLIYPQLAGMIGVRSQSSA